MVDAEGRIVLANREIERLFGYTRDELLGQSVEMLVPERFRTRHPLFRDGFLDDPQTRPMGAGRDLYGVRKDGTEVPVEIGLNPIETDEGMFVLGSIVDIGPRKTLEEERRRLEHQLRQAQKMEAVGTLAGGIAHDFNNILGAIIGYAELLESALSEDRALIDLQDLLEQAQRGRGLVQRLLAFSRRQESVRQPVALDDLMEETRRLLRAMLPATIQVRVIASQGLPRIHADAGAVQQVIINLGTNAAHAMPSGGHLTIQAESVYLRDSAVRAHPGLHEGPYIELTVSDDGKGMEPAVRERALEPFFTTKPAGEGSGLGLSMVHGIMREHEGALELVSSPGAGTTVRCFFPAAVSAEDERGDAVLGPPRGDGRVVLFVDDEPALVHVGRRRLERLGYEVRGCTDSGVALELFRSEPDRFDAVVTDQTMPGMTGVELAGAIRDLRPGTPILLLTGYMDETIERGADEAGIDCMAQKPLTFVELGDALAATLRERRIG
jgi:hypothetical protein